MNWWHRFTPNEGNAEPSLGRMGIVITTTLAVALELSACAASHASDAAASMDAGDEGSSCGHACEPCCASGVACLPISGYTTGFCVSGHCLADPPCDAAGWTDAGR